MFKLRKKTNGSTLTLLSPSLLLSKETKCYFPEKKMSIFIIKLKKNTRENLQLPHYHLTVKLTI